MKQLLNKYKTIPPELKLSFWFAACQFLQKGISFITTPIFTRLLSAEDYGLFSVYSSWSGIIAIFATLNLGGVCNNGMMKYKDDRWKFISSLQGLATTTTLMLFCIYLIFMNYVNNLTGLTTPLMLLMFINFLVSPALGFWSSKQRFDCKYVLMLSITMFNSIVTPIISIIAINLSDNKAYARLITSVLISAISSLCIYIYSFTKGKKFFVKEYWVFALKFNLPLIPHHLATIALASSDRILIERMVGLDKAGIYSIAYTISMVMSLFVSSINTSFIPWSYKCLDNQRTKELSKVSNILMLIVFVLTFLVILFSPEIVKIIAPPEYYEAVWIIPPVACSSYFIFLYCLFGNVELYYEKTKFMMVASIVGAVLNVILNILLIPIFGYLVAGYTTVICYILFAVMHYIFMMKLLKQKNMNNFYDMRFFTLLSVALIVLMIFSLMIYEYMLIRYLIILAIVVLSFIFRNRIIDILRRIKNK